MITVQCGAIAFPNIQAVIFDKDGTLADSHGFLKKLAEQRSHLIASQIPGIQEDLLRTFGVVDGRLNPTGLTAVGTRQEDLVAAAACITRIGHDWIEAKMIAESAFAQADQFLTKRAELTPLFKDAFPLLKSLAAIDLKLGILSADREENVRDFVEYYHLAPYFQLQMGAQSGSKPDPRLLQIACAALDVSLTQTIVIGDTQADIQLARRGGAIACGVTWGGTHPDSLVGADVVIDHFDQIQAWAGLQE